MFNETQFFETEVRAYRLRYDLKHAAAADLRRRNAIKQELARLGQDVKPVREKPLSRKPIKYTDEQVHAFIAVQGRQAPKHVTQECNVDGCIERSKRRALCLSHYNAIHNYMKRVRRYGAD